MDRLRTRKMNILLVEGMTELSERVRRIIAASSFSSRVHTVGNRAETLAYHRRVSPYREAPKPDIVLLGLSQSSADTRDIFEEIATNPKLFDVELVMLEDPRFRSLVGEAPPSACGELNTVELPALGELIDRIGAGSPDFSRAVGVL